jgi:hypothetical protein
MPDPKDPSRIVTTTTTTTFSMAKDMARSICQRFLEARFIESADGKYQQLYTMKGSVWQLTPKGICILDRFCSKNGIQQKQMAELVGSSLAHLVILERDAQTDKLLTDRGTVEVIFRRFVGTNGPNVKTSVSMADSDSLSDYRDGLTGVKMAQERKIGGKTYRDTFTGKAATDWLMDCCTTVDRRETIEIASLFVEYDLIECIQQDRSYMAQFPNASAFMPTKHAIYRLTTKGRDTINSTATRGRTSESESVQTTRPGITRDSNTQRLDKILNDPALRLLFRENLRETHCEENLSFYVDVDEFVRQCRAAIRAAQKNGNNAAAMDGIKEIMAQAYGIYNAFLAPGSPCELNIDHQLRNNLATRMTKAVGQDVAMIDTLHEVTSLFEDAQNAVFKLMASVSINHTQNSLSTVFFGVRRHDANMKQSYRTRSRSSCAAPSTSRRSRIMTLIQSLPALNNAAWNVARADLIASKSSTSQPLGYPKTTRQDQGRKLNQHTPSPIFLIIFPRYQLSPPLVHTLGFSPFSVALDGIAHLGFVLAGHRHLFSASSLIIPRANPSPTLPTL